MAHDPNSLDNRNTVWIGRLAALCDAVLSRYHRSEVRGLERIPKGKALVVGNHNGGLNTPDTWILLGAVNRTLGVDAVPYALGHDGVMKPPLLGPLLLRLGAVRATHENAARIFQSGHKIMVYPGGDIEASRPYRYRDRIVFGGRRGYIRLALRHGVPIVPVVSAGAHETFFVLDDLRWLARLIRAERWARMRVWPLVFSLPWGFTLGPAPPHFPFPSRILIEVLEPLVFERSGEDAAKDEDWVAECAHRVESTMQHALTKLAKERKRRSKS